MASVMRLASTASPALSGTATIATERPQSAKPRAAKRVAAPRAVATSPSQTPSTATTGSVSDTCATPAAYFIIDLSTTQRTVVASQYLVLRAVRAVLSDILSGLVLLCSTMSSACIQNDN